MQSHNLPLNVRLDPVIATMRATAFERRGHSEQSAPLPFVTISRETGAGAGALAQKLVERLNEIDHDPPAWTCWDRELVEKVAADHHLSKWLLETLEETKPSWVQDLFCGLSYASDEMDGFRVYRRVADTIRALAQVGHVVIVGRGGVFITRDLPRGTHVRLVAPLAFRIAEVARREHLTYQRAAADLQHKDGARHAFYARYWPSQPLRSETFTVTLNSADVPLDRAVDCLLPLIRAAAPPVPAAHVPATATTTVS